MHTLRMRTLLSILVLALVWTGLVLDARCAHAEDKAPRDVRPDFRSAIPVPGRPIQQAPKRWGVEFEGAWLRQIHTSIQDEGGQDGGGYAADRILTRVKLTYRVKPKIPLMLSFGYRVDAYDFDGAGSTGFPGHPWERVHSPRVTLPFFVPLGSRWFVVGGLTARSTVEEGVPLEDGFTWGGFFGASFAVSERLSIGPGFGLLSELEDDPSFFPVLVIDWTIRPNLHLKTGQGLGSTQGPGLFLEWEKSARWTFLAGGRFERLRFRLDDQGVAPGGIGEDESFGFVGVARYQAHRKLLLTASLGANFDGRLGIEDADGVQLFRKGYDPALLIGFGLTWDL
jgi:hypothetical protein